MVLLTMTQGMVEAIEKLQKLENNSLDPTKDKMRKHTQVPRAKDNAEFNTSQEGDGEATDDTKRAEDSHENAKSGGDDQIYTSRDADSRQRSKTESTIKEAQEPSLLNPKPGNPISHGQVVDLSRRLKSRNLSPSRLNVLLRGSRVYIPPPPPRPEPTSEYKALMARLRREEESRAYERMINPPPPAESFSGRFPDSSAAYAFSASHINTLDPEDEEVTFKDINRQVAVIFNVIISVVFCAAALWMAARWWSTPARLALSMSGSVLVGVAEVVVYTGYIRRVSEAKDEAKKLKEVKEVVNTWVVGDGEKDDQNEPIIIGEKDHANSTNARKRRKDAS